MDRGVVLPLTSAPQGPEDLAGKTISVNGLGGVAEVMLKAAECDYTPPAKRVTKSLPHLPGRHRSCRP